MSAPRRLRMRETPVFADIARASFAIAFELDPAALAPAAERSAFRISEVYRTVFRSGGDHAAVRQLFNASRSFLDDITTGLPGSNGRPLLFAGSAEPGDDAARRIVLRRPETWSYEFENTEVDLVVAPARREAELWVHELFCAFESGRLFFILMLAHDPAVRSGWDEYDVIRLQRACIETELAADPAYLGFAVDGDVLSLIGLANRRLAALAQLGGDIPNAIDHLLRPFGLLPPGAGVLRVSPGAIRNAMAFIDDDDVFATARHAADHYARRAAGEAVAHPPDLLRADAAWRRASARTPRGGDPAHVAASFGSDTAATTAPRRLLAFAGMAQAVPDFPRQDESEIHDSTRPAHAALENLFYVHPAFQLEVGVNWRSFRDTQGDVGACPYAILAWVIAFHDELIVSNMEDMIEAMVFGPIAPDAPDASRGRAVPLGGLADQLARVGSFFPRRQRTLDDNLAARLDIFRWCSIFQSGNVFRYPTERQLLDAIREARGTRQRFEDAHQMIDRHEALAEDLTDLAASYSAFRTNWLLTALALIGLVTLPKGLQELTAIFTGSRHFVTIAVMLVLALVFVFLLRNGRGKR